jgi:hypothetical protein
MTFSSLKSSKKLNEVYKAHSLNNLQLSEHASHQFPSKLPAKVPLWACQFGFAPAHWELA